MSKMYFRYGAMNCGKTTALLQVAHNYEEQGMNVLVLKPQIDKKGGEKVVSRLGIDRQVDYLISKDDMLLYDLNLDDINCILVDEAQFLTPNQAKELWIISKMKNVPVICYGLKTDFRGKLFEGSKAVIELADELEELTTICKCGEKARFNARIENGKFVNRGNVVAIDGIDARYEPLCGKCYIEKVLKLTKF